MKKLINIITPTYDYQRFKPVVQRGISSIIAQQSHDIEVRHIVVFDGEVDPNFCVENPPVWYKVEAHGTKPTHVWGIAQRNFGMSLVNEGWVWFFDHDNILFPDAFTNISKSLDSDTRIMIFRVHHVHGNEKLFGRSLDRTIPENLTDSPKFGDIDSLNFVVHSSIIGFCEWQEKWGHDYFFIQNLTTIAKSMNMKIKRLDFIVGEHT